MNSSDLRLSKSNPIFIQRPRSYTSELTSLSTHQHHLQAEQNFLTIAKRVKRLERCIDHRFVTLQSQNASTTDVSTALNFAVNAMKRLLTDISELMSQPLTTQPIPSEMPPIMTTVLSTVPCRDSLCASLFIDEYSDISSSPSTEDELSPIDLEDNHLPYFSEYEEKELHDVLDIDTIIADTDNELALTLTSHPLCDAFPSTIPTFVPSTSLPTISATNTIETLSLENKVSKLERKIDCLSTENRMNSDKCYQLSQQLNEWRSKYKRLQRSHKSKIAEIETSYFSVESVARKKHIEAIANLRDSVQNSHHSLALADRKIEAMNKLMTLKNELIAQLNKDKRCLKSHLDVTNQICKSVRNEMDLVWREMLNCENCSQFRLKLEISNSNSQSSKY